MLEAELTGMLPPEFTGEAAPPLVYGGPSAPEYSHKRRVEVDDARLMQSGAPSEAAFFAEHGFVLLPHSTAVRDWDREVPSVYHPEIEAVLTKRLFPGQRVIAVQTAQVVRRGRGRRFYARFVHSDGPVTPELYGANLGVLGPKQNETWFRNQFAREDVAGMVSIGFWRTVNMRGPLRHLPLAMCEPNSIERADIFPTTIIGAAPKLSATHHAALRFNAGQRWYYYPEVTSSEMIAFKICEFWKDRPGAVPQNVFHSAFEDPTAPAELEERESCEHRASVFILRD